MSAIDVVEIHRTVFDISCVQHLIAPVSHSDPTVHVLGEIKTVGEGRRKARIAITITIVSWCTLMYKIKSSSSVYYRVNRAWAVMSKERL